MQNKNFILGVIYQMETIDIIRLNLSRKIQEKNLTMCSLSIAAGLNKQAVRDIIRKRSSNPNIDTISKLAKVLGCSIDELCGNPISLDQKVLEEAAAKIEGLIIESHKYIDPLTRMNLYLNAYNLLAHENNAEKQFSILNQRIKSFK